MEFVLSEEILKLSDRGKACSQVVSVADFIVFYVGTHYHRENSVDVGGADCFVHPREVDFQARRRKYLGQPVWSFHL